MDSSIAKADIFFVITSAAVVLLTIFLIVGMFYFIGILRVIKRISSRAERTADMVADDIVELRDTIKQEGVSAKRMLNFFTKKAKSYTKK